MALIKRYANRKLYHSEEGRYITLEEIAGLVRGGEEVRVVDHDSGRDLTTTVLLQVVVAEEKRLGEVLPRAVLTSLLRNGGDTLDGLRARLQAAFDPEQHLQEQIRVRMARLVERGELPAAESQRLCALLLGEMSAPAPAPIDLETLRRQLETLERELARLRGGPGS